MIRPAANPDLMESTFERRAWIWDDSSEEPVEIDPKEASREELVEALENTRREVYELEMELTNRIERLQREIERLQGRPK